MAAAVRLRFRSDFLVKFNSQNESKRGTQGEVAPMMAYLSVCTRDAGRCITVYQRVVLPGRASGPAERDQAETKKQQLPGSPAVA